MPRLVISRHFFKWSFLVGTKKRPLFTDRLLDLLSCQVRVPLLQDWTEFLAEKCVSVDVGVWNIKVFFNVDITRNNFEYFLVTWLLGIRIRFVSPFLLSSQQHSL
jgi:hypothetical protein